LRFEYFINFTVPLDLLQFLRIKPSDEVTVRWEICPVPARYPLFQERVIDEELTTSQRLSVKLSGVNDQGKIWSFFLRYPYFGKDWTDDRKTTNHYGMARILS
jgi:hypothetical protein